ncbi:MAG: PP2C family serine/threonine-protein phosphatase [Pseudomonadota bacterium]
MTEPRAMRGRLAFAARVGQPFDAVIEIDAAPGFLAESAEGHEATGLRFDPAALRLYGIPSVDGFFMLEVTGSMAGRPARLSVELPVSPDPWALWQDVPSETDAPFARPDTDHAALDGPVRAVMASRRGRKHAHSGAHREDHAGIAQAGMWGVAAVADGAGSAALSREGARVAVHAALDALTTAPSPDLTDALGRAALALETLAAREARPVVDFATTLILGALRPVPTGWEAACISVGDGLAALWDGEGVLAMMTADGGEFAGQTRFLSPHAAAQAQVRTATLPTLCGFCLMTDGVSDAQFPAPIDETDPAHWRRLWAEIDGLGPAALCDWLNFRVQGEHDDRSLVILAPGVGG